MGRLALIFAVLFQAVPVGAQILPPDYRPTADVVQLSAWISSIQRGLKQQGFDRIFIGGGSARTVLDHIYFGKPLKIRDLDLFVTAGRPVDASLVEAVGRALESAAVGQFSAADLRPRPRSNALLPIDEALKFNAGFGFFMKRGADIADISIFHDEEALGLNGIFDLDRVMIPLSASQDLLGLIMGTFAGREYSDLVAKKAVIDNHRGYRAWQKHRPGVVNWIEFGREPEQQSLRAIRSYTKMGYKRLPKRFVDEMRRFNQGNDGPLPRLQLVRSVVKILEDKEAAFELKKAASVGAFRSWSPTLSKWLSRCSTSQLRQILDVQKGAQEKLRALVNALPERERLALLSDLYAVPQAVERKLIREQILIVLDAAFKNHVGIEGVCSKVPLDELIQSKVGGVGFLPEVHRILISKILTASERHQLMLRAILRRTPVAQRELLLAHLLPTARASTRQRVLLRVDQVRVATFTGVFNPFHLGHRDIITTAIEQKVLDKIIIMPTPTTGHNEKPVGWEHRLAMAGGALLGIPEAEVLSAKFRQTFARGGTGEVLRTLERLWRWRGQPVQWVQVMGADSFERFAGGGHLKSAVEAGKEILVLSRPGHTEPKVAAPFQRQVRIAKADIPVYAEQKRSSSIIRDLNARGERIDHLVPRSVGWYLSKKQLYHDPAPSPP